MSKLSKGMPALLKRKRFFAGEILALALLGLMLAGIGIPLVWAGGRYYTSPKIPPRTRDSAPVVSPLLPPEVIEQDSQPELPPAVTESRDASHKNAIHPVSFTEEKSAKPIRASAKHSEPAPNAQKPAKDNKSKKNTNAASRKDPRPVVVAPEPLLPAPAPVSQTTEPIQPTATQAPKASAANPHPAIDPEARHLIPIMELPVSDVEREGSDKPANNASAHHKTQAEPKAPISGSVTMVESETTANPPKDTQLPGSTQAKAKGKKQKEIVHFPEALFSPGAATSRKTRDYQNQRIYPVGYRPYVPSFKEDSRARLKTALQHYERAVYYGQQKRYEEARVEYTEALGFHPAFADAYVGLSSLGIPKNDWESVLENAHKALRLKEGFMEPANIAQARLNLGIAYCAANEYRLVKRYFKAVKKSNHPATEAFAQYIDKNCKP